MSKKSNEKMAHTLVASTAQAMAHEVYGALMLDNARYAEWKAQCPDLTPKECERRFVAMMWPKLLEQARVVLAKMLRTPLNDELKNTIAEALILDNSLMGREKGAGYRLH